MEAEGQFDHTKMSTDRRRTTLVVGDPAGDYWGLPAQAEILADEAGPTPDAAPALGGMLDPNFDGPHNDYGMDGTGDPVDYRRI